MRKVLSGQYRRVSDLPLKARFRRARRFGLGYKTRLGDVKPLDKLTTSSQPT
jgi:hypothetical protein